MLCLCLRGKPGLFTQIYGDESKFKHQKGPQIDLYMFNGIHLVNGLPNVDLYLFHNLDIGDERKSSTVGHLLVRLAL